MLAGSRAARRRACPPQAELRYVIARSALPAANGEKVEVLLQRFEVAAFDDRAAGGYRTVRADLEAAGRPNGPLDTLIAAHARSGEVRTALRTKD
jgi:tRNA(fMet)-specific endonuclease VapC